MYTVCRFLAGIGLAGELGGCITLVSEALPREVRGYGTMMVSAIGVLGAVVAGAVAKEFGWRDAYIIGGCLGLVLLILRISVRESRMFQALAPGRKFASQLGLLFQPSRIGRYVSCILIGLPCWYVIGLVVLFSPEFASRSMRPARLPASSPCPSPIREFVSGTSPAARSASCCARARSCSSFSSLEQRLASPRFFLARTPRRFSSMRCSFVSASASVTGRYLSPSRPSISARISVRRSRRRCRISAAARSSRSPCFSTRSSRTWAVLYSGLAVGWIVIVLAFIGLFGLRETFHDNLDYVES